MPLIVDVMHILYNMHIIAFENAECAVYLLKWIMWRLVIRPKVAEIAQAFPGRPDARFAAGLDGAMPDTLGTGGLIEPSSELSSQGQLAQLWREIVFWQKCE